ncbi:MAG: hypothetical protein A2283_14170 [Lentisphaerae bacterium RIFOXYA12_FULL_48_11]|nr:MAG: hypothetical protein A2283_14170 [Lentisphaerae bacterium RIFOXYA12_FULL_48_11]
MKCELIMISPEEGKTFPVSEGTSIIGRDAGNNVQLLYESVSRRHAKLEISPDACTIEDIGSSNGTIVNGKKISKHDLQNGDEIKIGDCSFKFHVTLNREDFTAHFIPRQYSDKSNYNTVKMKKAPGFLQSFLNRSPSDRK